MALDTYDNLKAAVIDMDGSNDISGFLDDALDMCESAIYGNEEEPLRTRGMETRATDTASTSSRFLSLPAGFIQMRRIKLVTGNRHYEVLYRTPETLRSVTSAGRPTEFTVTDQIEFDRVPDSAYTVEMQYYQKPTALSSSNTSNTVLTNYPNIYLFGCLWAVNIRNAEEEKSNFFWTRFINSIKGANKETAKGQYGPAPAMKVEGSTP